MKLETINAFFAIMTIIMQVGAGIVLVLLFVDRWVPKKHVVSRISLFLAWLVSLGGVIGPLVYSGTFDFSPCQLCWWARIMMFPQIVILGIANFKRDLGALWYSLPLLFSGIIITTFHILQQFGYIGASAACTSVEGGVACNSMYVLQMGYITIPVMALSAFTFMALLLILSWRMHYLAKNIK